MKPAYDTLARQIDVLDELQTVLSPIRDNVSDFPTRRSLSQRNSTSFDKWDAEMFMKKS